MTEGTLYIDLLFSQNTSMQAVEHNMNPPSHSYNFIL